MNKNSIIGIGQVLLFVIMSAMNGVFLSLYLSNASIFAALLCVFSIIAALFNVLVMIRRGRQIQRFTRVVWICTVFSNLTTATNWFSFFFAVKYCEPAIAATLVNSVLPLATIGISVTLLGQRSRRAAEIWWAVALCISMFATAFVVFSGHSGRQVDEIHAYVIGVAMALLCGLSIAFNTVVSKKLNELGVSPSSIMAYRFFLLIALAAAAVDKHVLIENVQRFHWEIAMIAVVGNLIPLFSLQSGIKRLSPTTVVFLNGLSPISFFLVQSMTGKFIFSISSLCCVLLSTITILFGVYHSSRDSKRGTSNSGSVPSRRAGI